LSSLEENSDFRKAQLSSKDPKVKLVGGRVHNARKAYTTTQLPAHKNPKDTGFGALSKKKREKKEKSSKDTKETIGPPYPAL